MPVLYTDSTLILVAKVFLSAFQEVIKDANKKTVRTAVNVDEHIAVLVRFVFVKDMNLSILMR